MRLSRRDRTLNDADPSIPVATDPLGLVGWVPFLSEDPVVRSPGLDNQTDPSLAPAVTARIQTSATSVARPKLGAPPSAKRVRIWLLFTHHH